MAPVLDLDRFESAASRFRAFFDELSHGFVERDELLVQCALALLSREHVLMTGPPGTAKSQMTTAVLGRIIDESTGEPSLFARQFTENTVHTDLVGPIDFKTLMESGRTTHFTDEGMLGAVHAFLDEVFDGRDMLLRSTLNLLQERELKQGGSIASGKIECAFMTSNRYISEILESSRDTLLAFVDRVAFVSFVPRGFAEPANFELVVKRHGGGFGRHQLSAPLSVQDLDVLQAAVDYTYVPDPICASLAELLRQLDAEMAQAVRADPSFQPTRYLSTRTAVKSANILRAIVVRDKIVHRRERPLQVEFDDLAGLRYHLVLTGMPGHRVAARLDQETDPRERRQLDIMRTEHEIFTRCLAKLPRVEVPRKPPTVDLARLQRMTTQARRDREPAALVDAAHALLEASESGASGADEAAHLLVETVGTLSERALAAGLTPVLPPGESVSDVARKLAKSADDLESAAGSGRPLARWLRGRLIALLDDSLRLAPSITATTMEALVNGESADSLEHRAEARLADMEARAALRRHLHARGTWMEDTRESGEAWWIGLARLEDELVLLWDAIVRETASGLVAQAENRPLREVLAQLAPLLARIAAVAHRLAQLGDVVGSQLPGARPPGAQPSVNQESGPQTSGAHEGFGSRFEKRVVGPKIEPLVAAVFARMDASERRAVVNEVRVVLAELDDAGLAQVIDPDRFVAWVVPALARWEQARADAEAGARVATQADYDKLRSNEDPLSLVETVAEVATSVVPPQDLEPEHPRAATDAVYGILRAIPGPLQDQIGRLDLARIERRLTALEDWWSGFRQDPEQTDTEPGAAVTMLEDVVRSGFLRVMRTDAEPVRLALEAENLARALPQYDDEASALRRRIEALDAESSEVLVGLLEGLSSMAWRDALTGPSSGSAGGEKT